MSEVWQQNIRAYRELIQQNKGPKIVNVVSGSPDDQAYWHARLQKVRKDIFRQDGETLIVSSLENKRKGNFLGSINAWNSIQEALDGDTLPPMILMTMVFGLGKRLSPFTQALANRKPAFPTPMCSTSGEIYLSTADIASMSATLWLHHLETNGFKGIIVKWGDEAIIPGKIWESGTNCYQDVDGLRFVWQTEPTADLAREKEWVEFDANNSQMTFQYTRQGLETLQKRLYERGQNRCIGVNLGSLGISYQLMQIAGEVFEEDLLDDNKWVDWDPYAWIALSCQDEAEWKAEIALEDQLHKSGMRELEQRIPDFYSKIRQVKNLFLKCYGRPPVIKVLDFGEPYWMDWGLQLSLRRSLEALTTDSEQGLTLRELFDLPHERDIKGNILLQSTTPTNADIRNSLIIDTIITDPTTVIHGGVVIAGRHKKLEMPNGGSALFCATNLMQYNGPHAIAFKSIGDEFLLEEGGRLTCLYLSDEIVEMRSNESLINYEGENYTAPVMGNPISFQEAARRMSMEDNRLVEKRWLDKWSDWLK